MLEILSLVGKLTKGTRATINFGQQALRQTKCVLKVGFWHDDFSVPTLSKCYRWKCFQVHVSLGETIALKFRSAIFFSLCLFSTHWQFTSPPSHSLVLLYTVWRIGWDKKIARKKLNGQKSVASSVMSCYFSSVCGFKMCFFSLFRYVPTHLRVFN